MVRVLKLNCFGGIKNLPTYIKRNYSIITKPSIDSLLFLAIIFEETTSDGDAGTVFNVNTECSHILTVCELSFEKNDNFKRKRGTMQERFTYFALSASCLSLGQTHASFEVRCRGLPVLSPD